MEPRSDARLTPADDLRHILSDCERALGTLRGSGEAALRILHGLDRITHLLPDLEARGIDLRAERSRLATLEGELRRKARALQRELRQSGGLAKARQIAAVDRSHWWWFLDEETSAERVRKIRGLVMVALVASMVLALGGVAYNRFLAPDPVFLHALELRTSGEELAQGGDYAGALAYFQQAQELSPHDTELQIWRGVLHELIGDQSVANEVYQGASALFPDTVAFHIARGQVYLQLRQTAKAQAEVSSALAGDPASPEAHMLQATILESQGLLGEAIASYEAASRFAEEKGIPELTAVARLRMAMLIQQSAMPSFGE